MGNDNNGISKKIFSVDLAGDLKSVGDAHKLVRTLLNTVVRANVDLAGKPLSHCCDVGGVGPNLIPKMFHIQISIFERSTS